MEDEEIDARKAEIESRASFGCALLEDRGLDHTQYRP